MGAELCEIKPTSWERRIDRDDALAEFDSKPCDVWVSLPTSMPSPLAVRTRPRDRGDFLWTQYSDIVVTDRARQLLEQEHVKGVEFRPALVALPHMPSTRSAPLWQLVVTGFGGFAASGTNISVRESCRTCGVFSYTVDARFADMIDEKKLDGTDLFIVWPYPLYVVVTERFREVVSNAGLTGVAFESLHHVEPISGSASPGLPSRWLSAAAQTRLLQDPDYQKVISST